MKIKAWGSVLLLSCLCSAVTAQNGNRYLEKPLPRGWGNTVVLTDGCGLVWVIYN